MTRFLVIWKKFPEFRKHVFRNGSNNIYSKNLSLGFI
jgi:hypothetical protein